MNTRKLIAAAASVAIVASTLAMFETSSRVTFNASAVQATPTHIDGRPVAELAPVHVYATPLPHVTVGSLALDSDRATSGFALPALENASLHVDSPLYMPYYSFASNLHTMIKE